MISTGYVRPSLASRVTKAALLVIINVVAWVVIPNILLNRLQPSYSGVPFSSTEVYGFGAAITALQALAALTERSGTATVFNAASYIAEAYYIYIACNGGFLTVTSGVTVELSFPVVMLLLMVYPLFNFVKTALTYLLEESEGSRPMSDEIRA